MASNDQKRMAEALSKIESSNPEYTGNVQKNAATFIRRTITLQTAATNANGSNAIAANASLSQWRAPGNGRVVQAHFNPSATATANATDYATVEVDALYSNGSPLAVARATQTTKPTANGGVGSLVAGAPVALTAAQGANARFTQGQSLAPKVSMSGSGVAMAVGSITVVVELEGPWDEAN